MMVEFIIVTIGVVLTVIQAFDKWRWFDWYGSRFGHIPWLPAAGCKLCIGLWISVPVAVVYYFLKLHGLELIVLPFACAGIINILFTFLKIH